MIEAFDLVDLGCGFIYLGRGGIRLIHLLANVARDIVPLLEDLAIVEQGTGSYGNELFRYNLPAYKELPPLILCIKCSSFCARPI